MQMQEASPYQQVLDNIRQLSRGEQLALIGDIVANLRNTDEYDEQDLQTEANILAESPTFYRLVEHGLKEVEAGNTRPVEELLSEL